MRTDCNDLYIPVDVLHDTSIPMSARYAYGVILTDSITTGYCRKLNEELATEVNLSKNRISKIVSILVDHGLVRREYEYVPKIGCISGRRLYPAEEKIAELRKYLKDNQIPIDNREG